MIVFLKESSLSTKLILVISVLIAFNGFLRRNTFHLNLQFPANARVGDTVFFGSVSDASEICTYNAYDDCGLLCSVSEKEVMLAVKALEPEATYYYYFNRFNGSDVNNKSSGMFFYVEHMCVKKGPNESFRLFIESQDRSKHSVSTASIRIE